jgi:hypothetical protein
MLESPFEFDVTDGGVGTTGNLILNDWENRDYSHDPFGWYQLLSVDGLWDQDIRFESYNLPQQDGARSGDTYKTGKTIVLSGMVVAADMPHLRNMQRALINAFADRAQHKLFFSVMDTGGHRDAGGGMNAFDTVTTTDLYVTCRKSQKIDMPETQPGFGWKRPFTIQLFADDPLIYVQGTDAIYDLNV